MRKYLPFFFFFLFIVGVGLFVVFYFRNKAVDGEAALKRVLKDCKMEDTKKATKDYIAYLLSSSEIGKSFQGELPPQGYNDYMTILIPKIYCRFVWLAEKENGKGILIYENKDGRVIKFKSEKIDPSLIKEEKLLEFVENLRS